MSPEAQRIAIAEACGWTDPRTGPYGRLYMFKANSGIGEQPPDYPTDLNAMHEAENVLTAYQRQKHGQQLQEILNEAVVGFVEDYARQLAGLSRVASATAAQRAEAFLRTIGKWPATSKEGA